MNDLIERLRKCAEFEDRCALAEATALGFVPEVYSESQTGALLREAAAALEAAREEVEGRAAELRAEVERWAQSAHEGWRYAKECDDGRVEEKQRTVTYVCPVCAASLERQE